MKYKLHDRLYRLALFALVSTSWTSVTSGCSFDQVADLFDMSASVNRAYKSKDSDSAARAILSYAKKQEERTGKKRYTDNNYYDNMDKNKLAKNAKFAEQIDGGEQLILSKNRKRHGVNGDTRLHHNNRVVRGSKANKPIDKIIVKAMESALEPSPGSKKIIVDNDGLKQVFLGEGKYVAKGKFVSRHIKWGNLRVRVSTNRKYAWIENTNGFHIANIKSANSGFGSQYFADLIESRRK